MSVPTQIVLSLVAFGTVSGSGEALVQTMPCGGPPVAVADVESFGADSAAPSVPAARPSVPADWWTAVQEDIAAIEYHITWQDGPPLPGVPGAWHAANRAQNLRTYFTPEGFITRPRELERDEASPWTWGLLLASWGRPDSMRAVEPVAPSATANRIEYDRGELTEWYINDTRGLEQGFTIHAAPNSAEPTALRLDFTVTGNVTAALTDGGAAIDFLAPGGARAIRFDKLHVVDAAGRVLPAAFDAAGATVSIVVDDRGSTYPITIDPLATSPNWTAESDQASAGFGASVAGAGDVNGDGYSDVIVGAPLFDNGQDDEGRAFVYHGSPSGLSAAANWTAQSNQVGAQLGTSVSSAGDVNGDGYGDVIVGAPLYDNGQTDEGRAFAWYGSAGGLGPNGTPGNADWSAEGDQDSASFGTCVATADDVNGDGYSDVIVGANRYDNGSADEGRALVYHGSLAGLVATAAWTAEGDQDDARFGISVSMAGDVNGDEYGDVIVGASLHNSGESNEGRAFVYHGSSTGLNASADWIAQSNQAGAQLGNSVSTAGDVNGDGFGDVIVGAHLYNDGESNEGATFVWYGSAGGLGSNGTPGNADWSAQGAQDDARFGRSVATAGDINGDGYGDVIVGAPLYDKGQTDEGRAFAWYGSEGGLGSSGTPGNADWSAEGDQDSASFGICVATAGDVNGDGYSDVIVGASLYDSGETDEGRAFAYHGSAAGLSADAGWTAEGNEPSASYGNSVAHAGDVNGDGYDDVIVGAPGSLADRGEAFVYEGSSYGLGVKPSWHVRGEQGGAGFGQSVATAGDVNGDGYDDVIVGAPGHNDYDGRAYAFLGGPAGLSDKPDWIAEGNVKDGSIFGFCVASAGDVNGDGYGDVIVGAPFSGPQNDDGAVFVYHGSISGLSTTAAYSLTGTTDSSLGYSVGSAGDVNGDGYGDVIIGAPDAIIPFRGRMGLAVVLHGSPSGLGGGGDANFQGQTEWGYFGRSVATAGDVNGDGYSDVIVGSPSDDHPESNEGRAYVYHGSASGADAIADWTAESNQAGAVFGGCVATAGDVNGDGYSDVIVGASVFANGESAEGRAFLYSGSATGLRATHDWTAEDNQTRAFFGYSVATAGDVNGDGYSEAIVGAVHYDGGETDEGKAFLYYGNGGRGLDLRPRQRRADDTGPIARFGLTDDTNTFRLVAIGRSPLGRGRVALQWEVKPLGTLMDGTGLQQSAAWMDTGTAGAAFNELVSGLAEDTAYHWRARVLYDTPTSPFQGAGPWFSAHGNGWNETDLRTPAPPRCPADFNGDGQLNLFDFLAFQTAFGNEDPAADINADGRLNLFDFLAFQTAFGNGC